MCGKKSLAKRGCATKRKTCFYLHGIHFSLGKDFSYWESCDRHVLIEKRHASEEDSALDSGRNGLQQLSLLIHAASLCLGGHLAPWNWSIDFLWDSCGPWG